MKWYAKHDFHHSVTRKGNWLQGHGHLTAPIGKPAFEKKGKMD